MIQQFTNGLSGEGLAKLIDNNFINEIPNLKITPQDTISKVLHHIDEPIYDMYSSSS